MKDIKKVKFKTGAEREVNEDKGRFDLLPVKGIVRVAKRMQLGAKKYKEDNWKKGMPKERFTDSTLRHIFQYMNNENGEDHLAAAASNLLMLMEFEENEN